jgi:hypothetical protein
MGLWPFDLADPPAGVDTADTEAMTGKPYKERILNAEGPLWDALAIPDRSRTKGRRIDYLDRARRAIRAACVRASVLGEIEESTVGLKSDLALGLVLGISVVSKSGVGKRDLSALVAAVHAEIDSWRLNSG